MLNLKLQTITKLIEKDDVVLDTCCDHAYLAIYLRLHNLCKEVYASDISEQALNMAKLNIKQYKVKVKTFLSDGLKDINIPNLNTVVIAGVGTTTALDIVNTCPRNINKIIISSNNNHYELRKMMAKLGYNLTKEIVVKEHHKFYPIMQFNKEQVKINKIGLKYGLSNNKEYFKYLLNKREVIISKIPKKQIIERLKLKREIKELKKCLKQAKKIPKERS